MLKLRIVLMKQFLGQRLQSIVVKHITEHKIGKIVFTSKKYVKAKRGNNYSVFFVMGCI